MTTKKPATLDCLPYSHQFLIPKKCINEGTDVTFFLSSYAYTDIVTFLLQLTASLFPRQTPSGSTQVFELSASPNTSLPTITGLRWMLQELDGLVDEFPPDAGPRRFGNAAFRAWYKEVEDRTDAMLNRLLPDDVISFGGTARRCKEDVGPKEELKAYLMGSWGSPQRLDYGTGHELSFLAFLGCLWKLRGFREFGIGDGEEERAIVLDVVDPYLALIRRLIKTYTLEPAGSHGVWGLDDHSFLPYIFGSAQLGPPITSSQNIPTEGSLPGAPDPADVTRAAVVERERGRNMYFGAVGFIYDVKKGPFWEHSPMLFDISGVEKGWAKINKGMLKMYIAEVLSKFPVVQHFPFGSIFRWERDPNAAPPSTTSAHVASHTPVTGDRGAQASKLAVSGAPWSSPLTDPRQPPVGMTAAPWATQKPPTTRPGAPMAPTARNAAPRAPMLPPTTTPWTSARQRGSEARNTTATVDPQRNGTADVLGAIKAPWAK